MFIFIKVCRKAYLSNQKRCFQMSLFSKIVLASGNAGKIREFEAFFQPYSVKVIPQTTEKPFWKWKEEMCTTSATDSVVRQSSSR